MTDHTLPLTTTESPGFAHALRTFHRSAARVPAYAQFLADHGLDPSAIRTPAQFATVPPVTKDNYLHRFPLAELIWDGDITNAGTWSQSSGSTGAPTYWPRDLESLRESTELYDRMFRASFCSHAKPSLLIDGFAMGNWIGGTYTYRAALALRHRGHRLSVIAPGIDADTIVANIADLGPSYSQIILAGYPPFVKDVLDRAGNDVPLHNLKILLAGENITEEWRDHVLERTGRPGSPEATCLIYGTADAGIMGHETPTTIAVRRLARTDERLRTLLFGEGVLPTFVEYDPRFRYTETDDDGRLLFTVDNTVPLVRYRINDEGRVLSVSELRAALDTCGHRLPIRTTSTGAAFLVLKRRTDIAASFYAVKLYPESVRAVLEDPSVLRWVTGKFVLETQTDAAFVQSLHLRIELQRAAKLEPGLRRFLRQRVCEALDRSNSEYRKLHATLGDAAEPEVTLDPFGSARFPLQPKHRYTSFSSKEAS